MNWSKGVFIGRWGSDESWRLACICKSGELVGVQRERKKRAFWARGVETRRSINKHYTFRKTTTTN